jgi:hypothetical protein
LPAQRKGMKKYWHVIGIGIPNKQLYYSQNEFVSMLGPAPFSF